MALVTTSPAAVYLVLGDTFAASFDGIVLTGEGGPIVLKARWLPGLRANGLFEGGRISEFVTRALREMRYLMRGPEDASGPFPALAETVSDTETELVHYKPRNPEHLVLLLAVGESDLWDIARELYPQYDFDLEPGTPEFKGTPPSQEFQEKIDTESVRQRIRSRCAPLFEAIAALQGAGFTNLFLNAIVPPSPAHHPHWPPPALRYKLAVLFNQIFEDFARENDAGFLSSWDMVFRDGRRRSEFDKDGVRLKRAGLFPVIERMQDLVASRAG